MLSCRYYCNFFKGIGGTSSFLNKTARESEKISLLRLKYFDQPYPTFFRTYSNSPREGNVPLPDLTDFPIYVWPNFIKVFRNYVFSRFIIKRYFDREFDVKEFIEGSKQAVETVSHLISNGRTKDLEGLVTSEVTTEINQNLKKFSLRQKTEIAIKKEDIFTCFPYEIGIILPDNNKFVKRGERAVEITMTYHVLKGYRQKMEEAENEINYNRFSPPSFMPNYEDNMYILNYRFLRDYSEDIKEEDSVWIINGLNHFKPLAPPT